MGNSKKGLTLMDLVSLSAGQVIGAGVVTLIGPAIGQTGMSAWLAYGVSVVIGFISILPIIFLSSAVVLRGGDYTIVSSMLGDKIAGLFSVGYITQCIGLSMLGTSLGTYAHSIFPNVSVKVVALIAVTVFFALNLCGVTFMAKAQKVLTGILVFALLAFTLFGLTKVNGTVFDMSDPSFFENGFGGFMGAVSLFAYSTYGQYMVIGFSKDAENPKRDIPLAILISSGIILVLYVGIGIVACGVLPLDQVANQPLTVLARGILSGPLFAAFIICGPLMALATTLNSAYGGRTNVLARAAQDGWFPEKLTQKNKNGVFAVTMTLVYLVGIIPILLGLSIKQITNNLVLVSYLLRMVTAVAVVRMPVIFEKQWKESFLHVPDPVFYGIMVLAFLAQLYTVYLSFTSLPLVMSLINVGFLVVCGIYAMVRYGQGKVHIDKITLE